MKKKVLAVLLATSVMMVSVTACGAQETGNEETVEKESESEESEETEESEENDESEESEEQESEETEESDEDATTESTEDDVDWSTMYDDFFERDDIMYENCMMSGGIEENGMGYEMSVATADGIQYMYMDFNGLASFNLYCTSEKLYCNVKMGEEEQWTYTNVEAETKVEDVIDMDTTIDMDTVTEHSYKEEVTEDGVVYDVLSVKVEEDGSVTDGEFFVNREKQKIEKMVLLEGETEGVFDIEEITSIEIPEEALNGTEVSAEEMGEALVGVIFYGAMAGMEGMDNTGSTDVEDNGTDVSTDNTDGEDVETKEVEGEDVSAADDDTDWAKAYDDYFERDNIMPKYVETEMIATTDAIDFEMTVAVTEKEARMYYDFENVMMDMYVVDEKLYIKGEMEGEEICLWTEVGADAEASDLVDTDTVSIVDTDTIISSSYREEKEEDGVMYDVLDVTTQEDNNTIDWTYYINRETQYIERAVAVEEDGTIVCNMKEIDTITVPDDFDNAEETDLETAGNTVMALLMAVALESDAMSTND